MKGCSYSGHSVIAIEKWQPGFRDLFAKHMDRLSRSGWRWLLLLLVELCATRALATPVDEVDFNLETLASGPVQNWIQAMEPAVTEAFDPQIFTEISPLIESPDAVRLPEEQTLAE